MTTTSASYPRQKEEEEQVAVPSLSDLAELGVNAEASSNPGGSVALEEAEDAPGEFLPTPSSDGEAYLILQPHTDPSLVLRFCQSLREIEWVDIAFLTSSPKGIAIKLTLRSKVPMLAILMELTKMVEVEEASYRERVPAEDSDWALPPFLRLNAEKALSVTLRAL